LEECLIRNLLLRNAILIEDLSPRTLGSALAWLDQQLVGMKHNNILIHPRGSILRDTKLSMWSKMFWIMVPSHQL